MDKGTEKITRIKEVTPGKKKLLGWGCLVNSLLWLSFVLGFASLGWLGGKIWLAKQTPTPTPTPFTLPSSPTPFNDEQQEWKRQTDLRSQRLRLGINSQFFQSLLDQVFALENPTLVVSQPLEIRRTRDALAEQLLDRLEKLTEKARKHLGSYTSEQLKDWTKQVNQLHLSSRTLFDLTDGACFEAFPQVTRRPSLDQPLGQVWAAFAEDVVENLNLGDRHGEIPVPTSANTIIERQGFLQPGEGQVYLISLKANSTLEIDLDADQSTLLSVYSPTGQHNLLEDSPEIRWSGTLPETGLYELTIVSKSSQALSYQLNLKINPP